MKYRGEGSGIALMFFISGILGTGYSIFGIFSQGIRKAEIEALADKEI